MSELERKYEERRRRQEEISRSNALVDYNRQKKDAENISMLQPGINNPNFGSSLGNDVSPLSIFMSNEHPFQPDQPVQPVQSRQLIEEPQLESKSPLYYKTSMKKDIFAPGKRFAGYLTGNKNNTWGKTTQIKKATGGKTRFKKGKSKKMKNRAKSQTRRKNKTRVKSRK